MKKLMIASAIAMMCFSANAFAEDDGYGNEVPSAWNDGTVDDGYGNKLPSNQSEYKSFGEARAAGNNQSRQFNIGGHFDLGVGGYWDYPKWQKNSWISVSFDLGGVFKYRVNNLLSVVPELNLGFTHTSRNQGEYDGRDIDETRMLFNINIPVTARVTPIQHFYAEAGFRLNFNLATSHTMDLASSGDYYYDDSRSVDLEKWNASTVVPSIVVGLGGTIRSKNHDMDLGLRLVLDLTTIEEDDITYWGKMETKQWAIQFVLNYYLF